MEISNIQIQETPSKDLKIVLPEPVQENKMIKGSRLLEKFDKMMAIHEDELKQSTLTQESFFQQAQKMNWKSVMQMTLNPNYTIFSRDNFYVTVKESIIHKTSYIKVSYDIFLINESNTTQYISNLRMQCDSQNVKIGKSTFEENVEVRPLKIKELNIVIFVEDTYLKQMTPLLIKYYHFSNLDSFMKKTDSEVLSQNK